MNYIGLFIRVSSPVRRQLNEEDSPVRRQLNEEDLHPLLWDGRNDVIVDIHKIIFFLKFIQFYVGE